MTQHTSLAAPSLCVAKAIRQYFQTGALPDKGLLCDADSKPLLGGTTALRMSEEDRVLMQAMVNDVNRVRRGLFY